MPHTARQVGRDVVVSPPCAAPGHDPRCPPARWSYPASRDLDLDYWVFGLTLSDEEGG